MENASKALLIAGAVLIVIVLISVGMMIVQNSSDIAGQVGDLSTDQAVQAFNTRFQNYQGNQKGASVRSLLAVLSTNNSTNSSGHIITVKLTATKDGTEESISKSADLTKKAADIVSSASYSVQMSALDDEGYITEITIKRK